MGTNNPDTTRKMRYFNNFFGQFKLTKKFDFITGFKSGTQQKTKNISSTSFGLAP